MSNQVTLNHDGFILGVPSSELQGPGVYEVEGGHVLAFAPLPITIVGKDQNGNTVTGTITISGKDQNGNTINETIPDVGSIPIAPPVNGG